MARYERSARAPRGNVLAIHLSELPVSAGALLLHYSGAIRCGEATIADDHPELRQCARELAGHPLSLRLLGRFLARAHQGDIRQRHQIRLGSADRAQGGHTFRMLRVIEHWLAANLGLGRQQLAIMHLIALFDRPVTSSELQVLLREPRIPGLTAVFFTGRRTCSLHQWNQTISYLEDYSLVARSEDTWHFDCHPLVREYFARRLRTTQPYAWRTANHRLYLHFSRAASPRPRNLEGLEPLFRAIAHGVEAGLGNRVAWRLYDRRIMRGNEKYALKKLGAISSLLATLSVFFIRPWSTIRPDIHPRTAVRIFNETGLFLRASGRLREALAPSTRAYRSDPHHRTEVDFAVAGGNHAELLLLCGELGAAETVACKNLPVADDSHDAEEKVYQRSVLLEILYHRGQLARATGVAADMHAVKTTVEPHPALVRVPAFREHSLRLALIERAAWRVWLKCTLPIPGYRAALSSTFVDADTAFTYAKRHHLLFAMAMHRQTQTEVRLFGLMLYREADAKKQILRLAQESVEFARESGVVTHHARALRLRGICQGVLGNTAEAKADLDDSYALAEVIGSPLAQAETSVAQARVLHDADAFKRARQLTRRHGFGRRAAELADLAAILS